MFWSSGTGLVLTPLSTSCANARVIHPQKNRSEKPDGMRRRDAIWDLKTATESVGQTWSEGEMALENIEKQLGVALSFLRTGNHADAQPLIRQAAEALLAGGGSPEGARTPMTCS